MFDISGLFKEIHRKVPSIAVMMGSRIDISCCNFKGDTTNDADTCGVLVIKSDAKISQC